MAIWDYTFIRDSRVSILAMFMVPFFGLYWGFPIMSPVCYKMRGSLDWAKMAFLCQTDHIWDPFASDPVCNLFYYNCSESTCKIWPQIFKARVKGTSLSLLNSWIMNHEIQMIKVIFILNGYTLEGFDFRGSRLMESKSTEVHKMGLVIRAFH